MPEQAPQPVLPDVSVVIPTYNRRAFLEEAVESCFEGSDAFDVEVVVVDDGSTDGTRDYLQSLAENDRRVRPFFQEHRGAQVARNRGMGEARGEFIKFLDSDDLLVEGALTAEVEALRASGAAICYGHLVMKTCNGEERRFRQGNTPDLISGIFEGKINTYPHVFLYRRPALAGVEWDLDVPYHQDTAFAIGVASRCPESTRVDQSVAVHRGHKGERVSTTTGKSHAPEKEKLRRQVAMIVSGVNRLRAHGLLNSRRRAAAAKGIWQWAHMIAAYDLRLFDSIHREIERLVPGYHPDRPGRSLRIADTLLTPRATEYLLFPLRRLKSAIAR